MRLTMVKTSGALVVGALVGAKVGENVGTKVGKNVGRGVKVTCGKGRGVNGGLKKLVGCGVTGGGRVTI